jgi:Na+-transporting NADH:ubiquinone oxidoreductase subunit F
MILSTGLTIGLTLAVFLGVVLLLVSVLLFAKAKLSPSGKIKITIKKIFKTNFIYLKD